MLRTLIFNVAGRRTVLTAVTLSLVAGITWAGEPAGEDWHRDWPSAWKDSQARSLPILLYITMDQCCACDKMSQETYSDKCLQRELKCCFVRAAISYDDHPRLVDKLNVQAFPTTIVIGPDANVLDRMTGYVDPQKLRTRLKAASARIAQR